MCAKTKDKPAITADDDTYVRPREHDAPLDPAAYARLLASAYSGGPLFA